MRSARRSAAPSGKGGGGGLDGGIDVGGAGHGSASDEFAGGGIGDIEELGGGRTAPSAIDVVLEFCDLSGYGTAHVVLLVASIKNSACVAALTIEFYAR